MSDSGEHFEYKDDQAFEKCDLTVEEELQLTCSDREISLLSENEESQKDLGFNPEYGANETLPLIEPITNL